MQKNKFIQEINFILSSLKLTSDKTVSKDLHVILKENLDWSFILNFSLTHEILNLIYHNNLEKFNKLYLSQSFLTIANNFYNLTLKRNADFENEFLFIQKELSKNNIKIIGIKGIFLNRFVYSNLALRPMVDIDILIKKSDIDKVTKLLLDLNYVLFLNNIPKTYWRKYHHHFGFYNHGEKILMEIHWTLSPPRPNELDISDVWERARTQKINDSEILILSPEDVILSMCLHLSRNITSLQFIKLKNLFDIHHAINQYCDKFDWNYIAYKINFWKLKNSMAFLIALTQTYFHTLWPIKKLSIPNIKLFNKFAMTIIIEQNMKKMSKYRAALLMLNLLDDIPDRLRLISQGISMSWEKSILKLCR